MATLITDPFVEKEARQTRKIWGGDKYDEVWEGVYFMPPMPHNEHQIMAAQFGYVFQEVLGRTGDSVILCGANVSDREDGWEHNYRVPDVLILRQDSTMLVAEVIPFSFRLLKGDDRPRIEMTLRDGEKQWRV